MGPTGITNVMPQVAIIFNTDSPLVVLYYIFRSPGSTDLLGPAIAYIKYIAITFVSERSVSCMENS